ncbi:alpha/beta hydrolase [Streptomyces desertarenae]|uniref:Alpha/beta hydrolase n=1 Tax=Streptomyces desertarenae TaxID=2666184 RepID=A0ABW4PRA1_9ACTN
MDWADQQMLAKIRAQEGNTKDAAFKALERLSRNYQYIQVECGLIQTALNGLADDLGEPQRKLKRALGDAEANGLTVGDDGSVAYPAAKGLDGKEVPGGTVRGRTSDLFEERTRPVTPAMPNAGRLEVGANPKKRLAEDISAAVLGALDDARRIDEQYAKILSKLTAERGLKVGSAQWADAGSDRRVVHKAVGDNYEKNGIPQGKSPEENAKWWKALSADERDAYVSLYPASVGALDGLPAEVRDSANRVVLNEEQARTADALAKHLTREPERYRSVSVKGETARVENSDWREWEEERKRLDELGKGMRAIENRFDQTGKNGLPEAYLLGFDTKNLGHAVIANGNPDTADHTAVFVPGTGARLGDIQTGMDRSSALWTESSKLAPEEDVSTIAWYGYDAPQNVITESPLSRYADDAAPRLNQFMNGLDASHARDSESHTTVVSHSYGTTVVGSAARQGELNTDDVIFAGSPGVQVGKASEMDVPEGHVWSQRADEDDMVVEIGRWGHGGHDVRLGGGAFITPSDELFGANRMATDTEGHSGYWDYNDDSKRSSESLLNQARVISGNYNEVTYD